MPKINNLLQINLKIVLLRISLFKEKLFPINFSIITAFESVKICSVM